jgi:hypothetical protein
MLLEKNPLSKSTHNYQKGVIRKGMGASFDEDLGDILSLFDYFDNHPEKFFSRQVFNDYYIFLNNSLINKTSVLKHFLNDKEREINIAIKSLHEISKIVIHDTLIPKNEIRRIQFIDNNIHFNFQRLQEGVFHTFSYPIAYENLNSRNKGTENMDLFNCNQVLEKTSFAYLVKNYDSIIRNGIAHNDYVFFETDVIYKSRGKEKRVSLNDMVHMFDEMMDYCNGMCLAIKTFCLINAEKLKEKSIQIPKQIVKDELICNLNTNEWKIHDLFESKLPDGRSQLIIYGHNSLLSYNDALFYSFRTALLSEKYISGYDRYFLNSESKYAHICFGGFNGKMLTTNRINNTQNYEGVIDDVLYFVPNFKLPRWVLKIRRIYSVIKIDLGLFWKTFNPKKFKVRLVKSHRKKLNLFVEAGVVLVIQENDLEEDILRNNLKNIIKSSRKTARKSISYYKIHKYLRLGYISVNVYSQDLRKRNLEYSQLRSELLCTIEVNRLDKINMPDIIGSKIEQIGNYRIAWNCNSPVFERIE